MGCRNVKECACPKTTCPNHGLCCNCIKKHRENDQLPYCLFPEKDKSVEHYYSKLQERFGA